MTLTKGTATGLVEKQRPENTQMQARLFEKNGDQIPIAMAHVITWSSIADVRGSIGRLSFLRIIMIKREEWDGEMGASIEESWIKCINSRHENHTNSWLWHQIT